MDIVTNLMQRLDELGVRLCVRGDELHIKTAGGKLSDAEIAELRSAKAGILDLLNTLPLARELPPDLAPATTQEEWYWLNFGLRRDCTAYRLNGKLDANLLGESLDFVVKRHESLRTRLVEIAGRVKQQIDVFSEGQLEITDFSGVPIAEAEKRCTRFLVIFFCQDISLEIGPLFDAKLVKLAEEKHVLAIGIHHSITDAESLAIFFRELWAAYGCMCKGLRPSMPSVSMQYADYGAWQRSGTLDWHEKYWNRRLSGAEPVMWPTDSGLEHVRRFSAGWVRVPFGREATDAIFELAERESTISALVFLAIYAAVVSRWCKQDDFVVAFNVDDRCLPEHSNLTGCLVYPLHLRIQLAGVETFLDLLKCVSKEFRVAYEYSDHGRLQNTAKFSQDAALQWMTSIPLVFGTDAMELDRFDLPFSVEQYPVEITYAGEAATNRFCKLLALACNSHNGVELLLGYQADLFKADSVTRFGEDLRSICQRVTACSSIRLSSLFG